MLFNVPQYIDVEDRVAGPFTAKQILWMFGMGAVLLIMWGTMEKASFFIAAVPVVLIFCALAFYRPHGQPLIKYVFYGITFAFKPKMYVWKRDAAPKKEKKKKEEIVTDGLEKRRAEKEKILSENINYFSESLDSEGMKRNKKMMEVIKKNLEKNKKAQGKNILWKN